MQVFLSAGYARRIGTNLSLGIAPTLAVERFKADGLAAFAPFSLDPAHLSGKGNDWAAGVGIRVGAELAVMRQVRIGAAYQSKFKMSRLKKYSGLIEGNGRFDVPSTWTLGIAVDVAPTITAMFDYRRINYSDTGAISNSPTIPAPLGSPGGPGFGWKNVNVLEMGVEAKTGTRWTWRAGAAFNNDPLRSSAVTLNILSPAVPQQHYTAGASYIGGGNDGLDFALTYAPKRKLTGIEITPLGPNPAHRITVQMRQFEATVGWTRRF